MTSSTPTDTQLRQSIKQQRRLLTDDYLAEAAIAVNQRLWMLPELHRAKNIGSYISVNGELNTDPFVSTAWLRKKRIFMPVLRKNGIRFFELNTHTELQNNRFGIPEPKTKNSRPLFPQQLNAILVPLVAFDNFGNRMGMGGGYYDRLLAFMKHRSVYRRPLLIGLAYDFQRVDRLITNSWDIPLHVIVTNTETYRF